MYEFMLKTAWTMTPPVPYHAFHIIFTALGLTAAVFMAYWITKKMGGSEHSLNRLFFWCGLILAAGELYKQLFLYYVVCGSIYDWWYFPFQLCSIPMYSCLLLPLCNNRTVRSALLTFLMDYSLLGGIMALAEPSGLMHPYWTLTLHGLAWHVMLIFIGLSAAFAGAADFSVRGFMRTLPLLTACLIIATVINVTAKPVGEADMFYISPYYPNNQIVFHAFALRFGITAGNLFYIFGMVIGGFVIHVLFAKIMHKDTPFSSTAQEDRGL